MKFHGLIRQRLGRIRGMLLPKWVEEGYADYVAGDGSFPEAEGVRLLIRGESHDSRAFQYFTWRKMVEYLIEERDLSFEEIVARAGDDERIRSEMIEWLRRTRHGAA